MRHGTGELVFQAEDSGLTMGENFRMERWKSLPAKQGSA